MFLALICKHLLLRIDLQVLHEPHMRFCAGLDLVELLNVDVHGGAEALVEIFAELLRQQVEDVKHWPPRGDGVPVRQRNRFVKLIRQKRATLVS